VGGPEIGAAHKSQKVGGPIGSATNVCLIHLHLSGYDASEIFYTLVLVTESGLCGPSVAVAVRHLVQNHLFGYVKCA